jgi:hypothetical protein
VYSYFNTTFGNTINYKKSPTLTLTFNQALSVNTFTACGGVTFNSEDSIVFEAVDDPTVLDLNDFADKNKLVKVELIPNTVTEIVDNAFYNCANLTSFPALSSSVTSIGYGAFGYCSEMTSFTMTSNVTNLGSSSFQHNYKLKHITLGNIPTIGNDTFFACAKLTSVVIPNSVTSIQSKGFYYTLMLTSITLSNSLVSIGPEAFFDCASLSGITFPDSLTSLGQDSFQGCTGLTSITISSGIRSLTAAFTRCLFSNYYVDPNNQYFSSLNNDGCLYNKDGTELIAVPLPNVTLASYTSPTSVTRWGESLLYISNVTSIIVPNTVTSIGNNAFDTCGSLTSITLPDNLKRIKSYTFGACVQLKSIVIPNSVTTIDSGAFANCNALTSVSMPSNLNLIGNNAFEACSSLKSISIPKKVRNLSTELFNNCYSLKSINIPSKVTSIQDRALRNCGSLTSLTIPFGVTYIGQDAVFNTGLLKSIYIPDTVTGIQPDAFTDIPVPFTLYTSPLDVSNPTYSYFNTKYTNTINYVSYIPCFKEDTLILTDEGYLPIQNLRKGDLVKTLKHGFLPIYIIGTREIPNTISKERLKDNLYVCSNKEYPEVFRDLIITGTHSILVDKFNEGEREKAVDVLGDIYITDDKYRLPACVDERAKPYEEEGIFRIYHFALENDNYFTNYGVYANGLLVETTSKRFMAELANMQFL